MRQMFREFRRAPARILASVAALALALGAMGVFAIPSVASSSLGDSVATDRMANLVIDTTDTGDLDVATAVETIVGIDDALAQIVVDVGTGGLATLPVVGRDLTDDRVDVVTATSGRLPDAPNDVLVSDGVASIGDIITVTAPSGSEAELSVVGVGTTTFRAGEPVAFTTTRTAAALAGIDGFNSLAIRAADTSEASLRSSADRVRELLGSGGVALTTLPLTVPDATHPIEGEIAQVSILIGFLGIVAGLVALVLLGSTTNTLITERTRETAVMRAIGARNRPVRRRLRRLAVAIAAIATVIGLPLGVVVSNVIARMVMQEFLGITPGLAVSVPVLGASAIFAIGGAALVASRAARRVTRIDLATALRDRDGSPFGRRRGERAVAGVRWGGLLDRAALRNAVHRRSRSFGIVAQITAAVAALLIIASLATTVNAFNDNEYGPWSWNARTTVAGSGLGIGADEITAAVDADASTEPGIETLGEVDGWELDVIGLQPDTAMIDTRTDAGGWLATDRDAVVTTAFADAVDIEVGDTIDVGLATGLHAYTVVGLHPLAGRTVFVDVDRLAADLGQPGHANVVYSAGDPVGLDGVTTTTLIDDLTSDDSGRRAILLIFGAIGLVVVAVAGLAVASGLAVNVYERRHEFAAMRAIGGRSHHVMHVVTAELIPLAAFGILGGIVVGYLGADAIVGAFERADAVDIGFTFATGALPAVAATAILGCLGIGWLTVRRVSRRSVAATLRSAS